MNNATTSGRGVAITPTTRLINRLRRPTGSGGFVPEIDGLPLLGLASMVFLATAHLMGDFYLTLLSHGHLFLLGAMFPILGAVRVPNKLVLVFPIALGVFFSIETEYSSVWGNLAKMGLLGLIFVTGIGCDPVRRVLSTPFLFIIGGACYTIYLIHYPLLSAFSKFWASQAMPGGFVAFLVAALFAVLIVSMVFFVIAERPFMTRRAK